MQEPGVIEMVISSCDVVGLEAGVKDSRWKRVLVVLNATPEAVERPWPAGWSAELMCTALLLSGA